MKREETFFTLNDLPKFSPWPARLLGLEPWTQKHKTCAEVLREYEDEKWGPLLAKVRASDRQITAADADEWILDASAESLCSINEDFVLLRPIDAHQRYVRLVAEILKEYFPALALVEFGAGYGSILLALAQLAPFKETKLLAGELTASGIELLKQFASTQGSDLTVGKCDLTSECVTALAVPSDAVIFTSYAIPYIPYLQTSFVAALAALRPRAVVHFEPCFEHCDRNTLLGLMRSRYIELNDYNTNLVTLLHDQEKGGKIKILDEKPSVFGSNPLLAASVIIWKPEN